MHGLIEIDIQFRTDIVLKVHADSIGGCITHRQPTVKASFVEDCLGLGIRAPVMQAALGVALLQGGDQQLEIQRSTREFREGRRYRVTVNDILRSVVGDCIPTVEPKVDTIEE